MKIKLKLNENCLTENILSIYSRLNKLRKFYEDKLQEINSLETQIRGRGFYKPEDVFLIEEWEEDLNKKDLPF
jgi:hypothetical protein